MVSKRLIAGFIGFTLSAAGAVQVAPAAIVVSFDNNTEGNPFRSGVVNSSTSFGGSVTDPDYNGGTSVTLSFSAPLTGVNVTTPANPDFTGASTSFFGAEGTGFGVGNTGLGRFDRGEAFTLHTTHAMTINSFLFHEWTGDEDLHISWVEGGNAKSGVFSMASGVGTAPANVTVTLSGIVADANTNLVITNVSGASADAAGRLRIRKMEVALVPEPASLGLLGLGGLLVLRRRR